MKAELVFFPLPAMGHITPMVELAKRLVQRDDRAFITIFLFKVPAVLNNPYIHTLHSHPDFVNKRIKLLELPEIEHPLNNTTGMGVVHEMLKHCGPVVKRVVEEQVVGCESAGQLAGFMLDFFCTPLIDVAAELGIPAYIFYASNCSLLSIMLHFQRLRDEHGVDVTDFTNPETELDIPGFRIPVPCKVLPGILIEKGAASETMLGHAKRYRSAKGILVNTFQEVEPSAVRFLNNDKNVPTVYPIGPIINVDAQIKEEENKANEGEMDPTMKWLDQQPAGSTVFLCFGSMGSFGEDQIKETAKGLEESGHRFLWSLRRPANPGAISRITLDYEDPSSILPTGFLDRTMDRGRVIGWAPQVAVLSHPSIGGFVSHCGWNSTLESLWFGVPLAAWPMYAEQQANAFILVKDLRIAVEIQIDYRSDPRLRTCSGIVEADVIKNGVSKLMNVENEENEEMRSKAKEMSAVSRNATKEGGSSYAWLGRFIQDVFGELRNKKPRNDHRSNDVKFKT
ncbi:UDP-glucose flavonoid 3-O-glucosyltransferase 6-like protein [Drosera capensis]